MANQPDEKLNLVGGGEASLYRNFQLKRGKLAVVTGDRVIVQHVTGEEEDVVVIQDAGNPRVKRLVLHVEMATSSPAVPAASTALVSGSLADVDADTETRLLEIYKRFSKQAA